MFRYSIATRPWSFTASIIPVLIASALVHSSSTSYIDLLRVLLIIVSVQAGANLTNTYYDFVNGVDTKKTTGDRTLVDKQCDPKSIFELSIACYSAALLLLLPDI